jgi:hypothetical protein
MALSHTLERASDRAEGQVTFAIENLRPRTTGLPFVVFVSQRGDKKHDIRVKVAFHARTIPSR